MLGKIDKALAGAIDVVADDIQNTVKSVKQQGVMRTLGDAVQDAGSIVKDGVGSAVGGLLNGRGKPGAGPQTISGHSGLSGGYADLCAGNSVKSFGNGGAPGAPAFIQNGGGVVYPYAGNNGGAAFPYQPTSGTRGAGGAAFPYQPTPGPRGAGATQFSPGGFAPGIGIQRHGPGASPGAFCPPGAVTRAPAHDAAKASPSPVSGMATGTALPKGAPLPPDVALAKFEQLRQTDPANAKCFDCGASNTEWVSVSFGVMVCIGCSGRHRQLGTHITRIRGTRMDTWSQIQLQIFEHGGNSRCRAFFEANGVNPPNSTDRYSTPAGEWYRECWIKNMTLGRPVPDPPAGIKRGPCVVKGAAAGKADASAAPAEVKTPDNLMDFGEQEAPAEAQADLLSLGGEGSAVPPAPTTDLLGMGPPPAADTSDRSPAAAASGGDLLGLGGPASGTSPGQGLDCLSLGGMGLTSSGPASGASAPPGGANLLGLGDPAPLQLSGLSLTGPAPMGGSAGAAAAAAAAPSPSRPEARREAAPPPVMPMYAKPAAPEPAPAKDDDPFAMALEKWKM